MTKRNLLRILERERESFAAERKLLIDQIMHLSNKTWTPPPRTIEPAAPEPEPDWVAIT